MLEQAYSKLLQKFILSLAKGLYDFNLGLFIRDFDDLPSHSSFDIDCLYDSAKEGELRDLLWQIQKNLNLVMIERSATNGLLIFLVDTKAQKDERSWAYFEFHMKVSSTCLVNSIKLQDLSYEFNNGLAVPTPDWRLLFLCVKLYRKDFRDRNTHAKIKNNKSCRSVCDNWLKNGRLDIERFLAAPFSNKHAKTPEAHPKLQFLKEFLFTNTPFLKGRSTLFTIQGPDGVGKTTLNRAIEAFFETLPIQSHSFHHITGWKYKERGNKKSPSREAQQPSQTYSVSFTNIIIRFIYRKVLPNYWKMLWVDISAFHKYVTNINKLIFEGRRNNVIYISDRYIDDLFVKTVFAGQPKRHKLLQYFVASLIEKPTKSLLLFDEAENIINRKKELSVEQINEYYKEITNSLVNRKSHFEVVHVKGKSSEEVADEAIRDVLNEIGPQLITSIKSWKAEQKRKAAN